MVILLTNDDGITAPGIRHLVEAVLALGAEVGIRAALAVGGRHPRVAVLVLGDLVGHQADVLLHFGVLELAADQALDREERVLRVGDRLALGRSAHQDVAVFLTDSAVGAQEEDNLRHLVTNLGNDVPRDRIAPFLTAKHSLEYCLSYAERAHHLANVRYTNGLSTQLEVSDARLQLRTAEVHEVQATRDYLVAFEGELDKADSGETLRWPQRARRSTMG